MSHQKNTIQTLAGLQPPPSKFAMTLTPGIESKWAGFSPEQKRMIVAILSAWLRLEACGETKCWTHQIEKTILPGTTNLTAKRHTS